MGKYAISDYKLIDILPSKNEKKKYTATLENKHNKKIVKINFGARDYDQYYDVLGYYKSQNHLDKKRRDNYYARHGNYEKGYYSPKYFSHIYLWPLNF